jgi:hypothetical protein
MHSFATEQGGDGGSHAHHYTSHLAFNPIRANGWPLVQYTAPLLGPGDATSPHPNPHLNAVAPVTLTTTTTTTTPPDPSGDKGEAQQVERLGEQVGRGEASVPRATRASRGWLDTERVPCIT